MSVFSTLSSLGIQKTYQRKAQLKAQLSQSPWRWSQRPSAKWHLAKQPDHQVLSLRCWSPLGKLAQWRCVTSLRTSSRRDAFQLTGRKASLSICTRAKEMLWIKATTGAWSWLSKWWRCWSVWWRDSSGKELRSMRCSVVQSMYKDVRSRVRVGDGYSEEFGVGVGVHQGSVLSPLLFIIVLEALSREFRTGCPWELLYADDLMISAESMEELLVKVQTWKTEMEKKGLRVNMGKTKIMESVINLDVLKKSGKYPCGVCQSGVGSSNAIFCGGCKRWVHKKCSGIKGPLRPDPEFRCARCLGTARAIDEREVSEVEVGNEKLEVVPEFCYLGDMLSAGGGCELAAITRCKCAWGKFRQLLPLLTNRHLPLLTRGKVYSSCVRSVMLHAAETCAMKVDTLNRLRRNERAMIRWICNVRAKDEVSSDSLLTKLGIQDLDVVLRTSRMRWFGHVEHSTGWIAEVRKLHVVAQKGSGRPRKSWDEVLENDRKKLGLDSADPQNCSEWRGRLRERLVKKPNPRWRKTGL